MAACAPSEDQEPAWEWKLPPGFPVPKVPEQNPMTAAKVALGKALFSDVRLSRNQTQSCASCHDEAKAFTDGLVHAVGSTGVANRRNAQGLLNVAYASTLTWSNPLLDTLEAQALVPLFGDNPVELGWGGHEAELFELLQADPGLRDGFARAFPPEGRVNLQNLTRALAAFERTLISGASPYDRWAAGDATAMSADAVAGLSLFNSERCECYHCHTGFLFSDSVTHASKQAVEKPFHNTGLYDVDGLGSYPPGDRGLIEVTSRLGDMGRFRAPSLRNLSRTAPYMHDGSLATLDDVLDAYAAGGHARQQTGTPSPLQSEFVRGFQLTPDERRQLRAFLDALDD